MSALLSTALGSFVYNTRTLSAPLSGVQRYARELDGHFPAGILRRAPVRLAQGLGGHFWEQFILPWFCRNRLLFSPANTGPLLCRDQVVTIHDASTFDCADAFTGLFGRWYRWLLPRLARRSLGVITISHFSRARLVATLGIPEEKIAVIYNGVSQPPATPDAGTLAEIRSRLNLPAKFLLFVGSRDPRKNLDRLMAAYVAAGLEDCALVIAGGINRQLFKADLFAAASDRILVLGHVDDRTLEALYFLATGFVFPSLYEGFGLPPLEAMARGCPVLCSDASCLPEVCGPAWDQGGACLFFSPDSVESIAAALRKFAALPAETRRQMAVAGRVQASRYSWARCAEDTTAALLRFAGTSPRLSRKDGATGRNGTTIAH